MKLKTTLMILFAVISIFCYGGGQKEGKGPTAITIAVNVGPEADAHHRLANEFERQFPQYAIIVDGIARSVHSTKMATLLSAGSDIHDVMIFSTAHFPLWYAGGWIEPLDNYMNSKDLFNTSNYDLNDFPEAILNIFRRKGNLFALPQEASAYLLFYRKDILNQYGIDEPPKIGWSWKQYISSAQKIQKGLENDGITDMYATVFAGRKNRNIAQYVLQNVWANGGELLDEKLKPQLTSPHAIEALKEYTDQLHVYKITPPGVIGYAYSELLTTLQQGLAALGLQWNAAAATLLDPEKSPKTAGKMGFSVIPYFDSKGPNQLRVYPSIWGVGISSFGKHKEAAFRYVVWFTSKEIARDYVTHGGGSSGRSSLLNDPQIVSENPQYPALLESMKYYHSLPDIPEWTFILEDILTSNWNSALVGDVTPKQAMETANEAILKLLEEAGYY